MVDLNWPGVGVAYMDMLILFRMHTHYPSLPPGPTLHSWKTPRPEEWQIHVSRIMDSMYRTSF